MEDVNGIENNENVEATPPFVKRTSNDNKKSTGDNASGVTTRNWARKAKIQTRAMAANAKPSSALLAAKKKAKQKKPNVDMELRDHFQTARDAKNSNRGPVELVLERRMVEHLCLWDSTYPECPERLSSIIKRCEDLGLVDRCVQIETHSATKEDVLKLHSESVYDLMLSTHQSNDTDLLEQLSSKYDAIYIHPTSHELALMAAGSTVKIVEDVVKEKAQYGMALVRPPGHHAMKAEPCGYCFYNNVGLAAKHAIDKLNLSRILIVDWDVHHGQATQQMFYDDPRVLYFSIHRYENGTFWPNLRQSDFNYIGSGKGLGNNFNVPLNKTKMQDSDYLAIWHQILMPVALEYQPQLVLVSAGYDAALGCPEFCPELVICSAGYDSAVGDHKGEMEVTPACYAHLTHMLMGVCKSMVVVLEGGYCLSSLSESAALTLRTLLGDPVPPLVHYVPPCESMIESILDCIYAHKPYWHCFNYQPTYSIDNSVLNVSDVNKIKHNVELKWLGKEEHLDKYETRNCYPVQNQSFIDEVNQKLSHLKIVTDLSVPPNRVCYVYDDAMLKHKNMHETDHPERPERISRIYSRLMDWKLLKRMHKLESRVATEEELSLAHTPSLLTFLQGLNKSSSQSLYSQQVKYDSVYLHNDTYVSASTAVGNVLQVVDAVLGGEFRSGVCVVRPPGHHASEDMPCGFCLFNNVGVAAKYAISSHSLKRILILDWDVHHGNGTQSMFINDPKVLYVSLHRYDYGTFFPSTTEGNYTEVGNSSGRGFNVNIPWNKRGMGDKEYLAAFTQVVLPIAYEFNPELILVSAGFDACVGDPLGGCKVSPECFGQMTHWLSGLAKGKVILCLEGGYNVTSISYSMAMCTKALLGDPAVYNYENRSSPHPIAIDAINDVISVHKQYWKNLCFQVALPKENVLPSPAPSRGLEDCIENKISNEINEDVDGIKDACNISSDIKDISSSSKESYNENDVPDKSNVQSSLTNDLCINDKIECGPSSSRQSDEKDKITLSVFLADNAEALLNEEMYAVIPLNDCPHLDIFRDDSKRFDEFDFTQRRKCINCDHNEEIWICLHCNVAACGRYINGHMLEHFELTEHPMVLSLVDLSVWCASCEAYVDNSALYTFKNKAHVAKFGEEMPWTYDPK